MIYQRSTAFERSVKNIFLEGLNPFSLFSIKAPNGKLTILGDFSLHKQKKKYPYKNFLARALALFTCENASNAREVFA